MFDRLRLHQITPRKLLTDVVQITPQGWKSDPEVINKHNDLYARAWEYDYEMPIFDTKRHNIAPHDPANIALRSDLPPEETRNAQGTSRECSLEFFPSTDGLYDGTDTYQYAEHGAESITLFLPTPQFKILFASQSEA